MKARFPNLLNISELGVAGRMTEVLVVPGRVSWLKMVAQLPAFGAEQPVVETNTVWGAAVVDVRVEVPLIACTG